MTLLSTYVFEGAGLILSATSGLQDLSLRRVPRFLPPHIHPASGLMRRPGPEWCVLASQLPALRPPPVITRGSSGVAARELDGLAEPVLMEFGS